MSFNTLYVELQCPFCQTKVNSGVGFQVGAIENRSYKIGDSINWSAPHCRPAKQPKDGRLKTIGYFNCDNPACSSWTDCYPQVQNALIVINNNQIVDVSVYNDELSGEMFEILESAKISNPERE